MKTKPIIDMRDKDKMVYLMGMGRSGTTMDQSKEIIMKVHFRMENHVVSELTSSEMVVNI